MTPAPFLPFLTIQAHPHALSQTHPWALYARGKSTLHVINLSCQTNVRKTYNTICVIFTRFSDSSGGRGGKCIFLETKTQTQQKTATQEDWGHIFLRNCHIKPTGFLFGACESGLRTKYKIKTAHPQNRCSVIEEPKRRAIHLSQYEQCRATDNTHASMMSIFTALISSILTHTCSDISPTDPPYNNTTTCRVGVTMDQAIILKWSSVDHTIVRHVQNIFSCQTLRWPFAKPTPPYCCCACFLHITILLEAD